MRLILDSFSSLQVEPSKKVQAKFLFIVGIILLFNNINSNNHVHAFKIEPHVKISLLNQKRDLVKTSTVVTTTICNNLPSYIEIRGGGSDKESDYEEEDEEYEEEDMSITSMVFSILGDTVVSIINILSTIVNSALGSSTNSNKKSISGRSTSEVESYTDFGEYLSTAYDCIEDYDDEDDESRVTVQAGSLLNALSKARSNARLLVAFIPGSKPKRGKSYDRIVVQSILSPDVNAIAEKKIRKKEKYGSFLFWAAKYDSNEASKAMKRLKVKPTKKKSPTLVVVYPAQTFDSSGRPKIVAKVLGQHHCNPPPSSESMSAWLASLRKRHMKQYSIMQKEQREIAFTEERTKGYESSMKEDKDREEKEQREEEQRLEEERIQAEKEEHLKERRKSLLESLPEEPNAPGEGIITIALRFSDGRSGQRRFNDDTDINVLFNWVDGIFELEREKVILTTMNGQKTFSFGEGEEEKKSLKDSGLGRMAALRVSTREKSVEDNSEETTSDTE